MLELQPLLTLDRGREKLVAWFPYRTHDDTSKQAWLLNSLKNA